MNSAVDRVDLAPRRHLAVTRLLRFIWAAWQSITRAELRTAALIGLAIGVIGALMSLEFVSHVLQKNAFDTALAVVVLNPVFMAAFGLLAWTVADRGDDLLLARTPRLTLALLAAALAHALITPVIVYDALQLTDPCLIKDCAKEGVNPPRWLRSLGGMGHMLVFGGLGFALIELRSRSCRAAVQLAQAQQERAQLTRTTYESRLAAMQAQVEPQFLFDGLVDIQALYDENTAKGAAALDRLIGYLRTALPRLRESGSTVLAEVDLLHAYLSVVQARHDGLPAVSVDLDDGCARTRFYPMLLLPLVQRAVRGSDLDLPRSIALRGRSSAQEIVLTLTIARSGLCSDDAALARVRERLAGLFDGRASLLCDDDGLCTTFTLTCPHEQPDRHRR